MSAGDSIISCFILTIPKRNDATYSVMFSISFSFALHRMSTLVSGGATADGGAVDAIVDSLSCELVRGSRLL